MLAPASTLVRSGKPAEEGCTPVVTSLHPWYKVPLKDTAPFCRHERDHVAFHVSVRVTFGDEGGGGGAWPTRVPPPRETVPPLPGGRGPASLSQNSTSRSPAT